MSYLKAKANIDSLEKELKNDRIKLYDIIAVLPDKTKAEYFKPH